MASFDASEIQNWADHPDAPHCLPELVRRLVLSTVPNLSLVDMPSGSSIHLPGWDGLLVADGGNAWVPSGASAWEFSCEKGPQSKATADYEKRTANPKDVDVAASSFVFVTPRRWSSKRRWANERSQQGPWLGVRVLDANDLVAWLEQATEVAHWFARLIGKAPAIDESLFLFGRRQEELHTDSKSHIDSRFDALETRFSSLLTTIGVTDEPTGLTAPQDSVLRELSGKIDFARGLVDRGLVRTARRELEQLREEAGQIPAELEFRIVTNLGACALAREDIDDACALLKEAHNLQPENPKGITNAAVAAHLNKDSEQAMELAHRARELDPHNSQATAVLIGEFCEANESERLDDLVAAEEWITRDRQCGLILASIRAEQSRFEDATDICRSISDADPTDANAHLAFSQCLVSYAQSGQIPVGTEEWVALLNEAVGEATNAIELLHQTELSARCHEAFVSRAVARALLGSTEEVMRDLEQVLSEAPNHSHAAYNKGLLLLQEGRTNEASAMFDSIEDPELQAKATLPRAQALVASGDPSSAAEFLRGMLTLEQPGWKDVLAAEILFRAEALIGEEDSVGPALDAALEQHPDDPRLLTVAAARCYSRGDRKGVEDALMGALSHAEQGDRQEILPRLGSLYHESERFTEAADCLIEVIGGAPLHPACIPLLVCLTNSKRLREALDWARKIRKAHWAPPRLALEVEAQVLDYAGDLPAALLCLHEICSRADATEVDQVKLASAQFRRGDYETALSTILRINASRLCGDARSILELAQMKLLLGQPDYLDDAYLARRHALNDPAAHLGYFAMFMGRDRDWVEPETIGVGCAILLKSESDEQWWHILDEGEERLGPREVRSSDELAQRLMGKGVGDTILLREGIEDLSYEVEAVQSKFVRAFQETLAEFSTRFPSDQGLSRIKADDDLTQLLHGVDQRDQFVRRVHSIYMGGQLPLASFSSSIGRSLVEVWHASTWRPMAENGFTRIRFGTGTAEDAEGARRLLNETDSVVLDLLALLTVYELGLAEQLRSRFKRVTVPQYAIDELQKVYGLAVMGAAPASWLGKSSDGQYTLVDTTEGEWAEWREHLRLILAFARSFAPMASYPLLDSENPEKFIDVLTGAGAGAVFAGDDLGTSGPLLICDDLGLSQIARSLGVHAVNTQAVLKELHDSDTVTSEEYSAWVERLVLMNYWFVQVSPEDIVRRLEASGYMTTDGTRAMLGTLQGPDCLEESAVTVAAEIIIELAGKAPRQQVGLLLDFVVATLRHGREMSPVLLKLRGEIASRPTLAPLTHGWLLRAIDLHLQV